MTDRQIIIDSIDVSACEFLTKTGHCKAQMSIMGTDANKCKCFPNCYYKQLKRKEQECERLKHDNEYEVGALEKTIDNLKEENDELKKANKHIEHNRNQKADKLMRIEKFISACLTSYTDEFIQELLVILHEPETNMEKV